MARMAIDEKSPSLREALRRTQSMCMFVWSTERVYILDKSEVFFLKYLLTKVNTNFNLSDMMYYKIKLNFVLARSIR